MIFRYMFSDITEINYLSHLSKANKHRLLSIQQSFFCNAVPLRITPYIQRGCQ